MRDLLLLIARENGTLRAKDLNQLAIRQGVLVRDGGEPFRPTTIYHYRRILERLGLVVKDEGRFLIRSPEDAATLTCGTAIGEPLTNPQRSAFASAVVTNRDCHEIFFRPLLGAVALPRDIDDFLERAGPATLSVTRTKGGPPTIRVASQLEVVESKGEAAVQAIVWGIKLWCTSELNFIDELLSIRGAHQLLPRRVDEPLNPEVQARRLFKLFQFTNGWATQRIEDLLVTAAINWKSPITNTREVLLWILRTYPHAAVAVPTSEQFALNRLPRAQRDIALRSYLRLPTGQLVSHIRLHKQAELELADGGRAHARS
ncbi:MAG: hypothetical protein WEB00_12920 [Dehalococcoidia bacterium]